MRELTTAYTAQKNKLEGTNWFHVVELEVNANTTAYFTTWPETVTWNGKVYAPVPMRISSDEMNSDGQLPGLSIDIANVGGQAFKFARDNDLSFNNVTVRRIEGSLTTSGNDIRTTLQILGATFVSDVGRISLGPGYNYDAEGPLRTWNRRDFPSIPMNFRQYAIL